MIKIWNYLEGKKTIIGILAGALYSILITTKVVPSDNMVWTVIATWTGVSYRLAIK